MKKIICTLIVILIGSSFPVDAFAISRKAILAEKLYLQGDYQSAAYECERLYKDHSKGEVKNELAHLAGLCYLKLNNLEKARKYFEYVLGGSGNSRLIAETQIGLDYISKKLPSKDGPSLFSIQVGSFKKRKNAVKLFKKFKRRKYTVRITEEKNGPVIMYKVKIGRFKSKEGAVKFAKKLNKSGHQTAIAAY